MHKLQSLPVGVRVRVPALSCTAIQSQLLPGSPILPPSHVVAAHIAQCTQCRRRLDQRAQELFGTIPTPISHDVCFQQLPMIIDHITELATRAIGTYPEVWYHLWTCGVCTETLLLTLDVVQVERGQPFEYPFQQELPPALGTLMLRLTRASLSRSFASLPLFGGQLTGAGEVLLAEKPTQTCHNLRLSVAWQHAQACTLVGTTTPPLAGRLVIALDRLTLSSDFDSQGTAKIPNVPTMPILDPNGPELLVGFQLDES